MAEAPSIRVSDRASPALNAIFKRVQDKKGLLTTLGRSLAVDLKAHFRKKDMTEPNKLGARRTHYWREVADSVSVKSPGSTSIAVGIGHPTISQKVYGGTITPKRAKALTIPVHPDGHGRMASEVDGLFVAGKVDQNKGVLARKAGGGIEVIFLLRKSVTQDPDPTALPNTRTEYRKLVGVARKYLDLERIRNQASPKTGSL
jgi:hypothetical protein